jgi:TrmH family RNA methyltransferase
MNRFRVVLVDPRFAANIGFAARVCTNFGVEDYRGVTLDSERWHWDEAKKIAVAPADRLLESFQVHSSVGEAIADCDMVIGLTRRFGEDRRPELTPGSLAALIQNTSPKKVALLFGNEETGLTEDELRPCTHLCMIPTSDVMPSMNLSHAVAVVLSRLREDLVESCSGAATPEAEDVATASELSGLFGHWREFMVAAGMTEAGNPERLLRRIERILHRARISGREVKILRGILAKALHRMLPRR